MIKRQAAMAFLLLGGCALPEAMQPLSLAHPANPDAPVALPFSRANSVRFTSGDRGHDSQCKAQGDGEASPDSTHESKSPTHGADMEKAVYACPMHPEVVSTDPAARCPKCGMALEPRHRDQHEEKHP